MLYIVVIVALVINSAAAAALNPCFIPLSYSELITVLRHNGGILTTIEQQSTIRILKEYYQMYPFRSLAVNFTTPPQYTTRQDILAALTKIGKTRYNYVYDFEEAIFGATNLLNDAHAFFLKSPYLQFATFYQAFSVRAAYPTANSTKPTIFAVVNKAYFSVAAGLQLPLVEPASTFYRVFEIDGQNAFNVIKSYSDGIGMSRDSATRFNLATLGVMNQAHAASFFTIRDLKLTNTPTTGNMTFFLCPVDLASPNKCVGAIQTMKFQWLGTYFTCTVAGAGAGSLPRNQAEAKRILDTWKQPITHTHTVLAGEEEVHDRFPPHMKAFSNEMYGQHAWNGVKAKSYGMNPLTGVGSYVTGGNVLQLRISTFTPKNPSQFQLEIASAIGKHLASGGSEILIDLTGNGGGYIVLMLGLLKFLNPHMDPLGDMVMDVPRNKLSDVLFGVGGNIQRNKSYSKSDCISSLFLPCVYFDSVTQRSFSNISWYKNGPSNINRGNSKMSFSKLFHPNGNTSLYAAWLKYSAQLGLSNTTSLYAPSKLTLLSAGYCGSACGMFAAYNKLNKLAKTVVFGGFGQSQSMSFWSYPGGEVFSLKKVVNLAGSGLFWFNQSVACNIPSALPHGADQNLPLTELYHYRNKSGLPNQKTALPLEYTFVPADYQLPLDASILNNLITNEMAVADVVVNMMYGTQPPGPASANGPAAGPVLTCNTFFTPFIAMAVTAGILLLVSIGLCCALYFQKKNDPHSYQLSEQ